MAPVDLHPPADFQHEAFPLQASHMHHLQLYVHSGVHLPTTPAKYQQQYTLADATVTQFKENVNAIVNVYGDIRDHTMNFKKKIFPAIVGLASSLYAYSNRAIIYYEAIENAIHALDQARSLPSSAPNDSLIEKNKERVGVLVDEQVATMTQMRDNAAVIVEDLRQFENATSIDQTNVERERKNLDVKLEAHKNEISALRDKVKQLQQAFAALQNIAYERKQAGVVRMGWIQFIGWISIDHLKSELGISAKALSATMTANKENMDAESAQLGSCLNMAAQGSYMEADLARILKIIRPAITTIQLMQGGFGSIVDDLESIKNKVDQNIRDAKVIICDVRIEDVLESWKSLGERADQYRLVAYVRPFNATSDPIPKVERFDTTSYALTQLYPTPAGCFPAELYGRIFAFVEETKDLINLCTLSKLVHQEAERVLYNYVNLANDHFLIMRWFQKIAQDRRAGFVRALTFGIVDACMPWQPHRFLEIIAKGLRALVNLKDLHLHRRDPRFMDGKHAWIIRDHPFQLKAFRNDMFDLEPTIPFLSSQKDLVVWEQRRATICDIREDILPNLTRSALDTWMLHKIALRSIQRLELGVICKNATGEREFIETLGKFSASLVGLDLSREVVEDSLSMADFIGLLAQWVPRLTYLCFRNKNSQTHQFFVPSTLQTTESGQEDLALRLWAFTELATLCIFPASSSNRSSLCRVILSETGRTKLVSRFFLSSPALRRVAFPDGSGRLRWYARSAHFSMIGDTIVRLGTAKR